MCGIVGFVNLDNEPVSVPLLRRMTDVLAHRGPNGEGQIVDGGVGLGHRRLAIIDLTSAGHQPISNETDNVFLTYNGEIYNFQDLRVELEARGHMFHSRTDSEVVVHAYEEWGTACVDRFNGMFAFAIWDARHSRLFLARDRFGVKPLYYYWDGDRRFVFASEIKAILLHPAVPKRVCLEALSQYFTFQNVLTDQTLFEGIRILPAGTWLTVDPRAPKPVTVQQYWDFVVAEDHGLDRAEAAEELRRLFTQAVVRQLVSDVPIGSYLSGGMDSGSITSIARGNIGRLVSFTCGFDLTSASGLELAFDERSNAEVLSNLLKTEHYEVVLHAGDMEHVMPELIWHLEDLRVGQCYPNYYVARLAGKFVRVVLSGTGGDELVAGYPWRYDRGLGAANADDYCRRYYGFWQRLVPDTSKQSLFRPAVNQALDTYSTFEVFRSVLARALNGGGSVAPDDLVNASLYFEVKTFLHGLLVVEDKVSMAHGLETRVPFLDLDLVDFIRRIPVRYKLKDLCSADRVVDENDAANSRRHEARSGGGKMILRDAMARIIPPHVIERTKQGFSAPDASWFRGESIDYITQLLRDPHARIYEFLETRFVASRLDEHVSGASNNRLLIWSLLSLEWWLRKFLN